MKVVSDSSTLIALARIDSVHLLPKLYGQILIPTEVYIEVVIEGAATPRQTGLGAGEVSAIIRAEELSAGLTLIDEPRARWYAKMRSSRYYRMHRDSGDALPARSCRRSEESGFWTAPKDFLRKPPPIPHHLS